MYKCLASIADARSQSASCGLVLFVVMMSDLQDDTLSSPSPQQSPSVQRERAAAVALAVARRRPLGAHRKEVCLFTSSLICWMYHHLTAVNEYWSKVLRSDVLHLLDIHTLHLICIEHPHSHVTPTVARKHAALACPHHTCRHAAKTQQQERGAQDDRPFTCCSRFPAQAATKSRLMV
jgi:hypothetical protein